MPLITDTESYEYRSYTTTYLPCTHVSQSGISYGFKTLRDQYNDTISRVKPQEPLFLSPTGLPLQYTEYTDEGLWRTPPTTSGGILCYTEDLQRIFAQGKETKRGVYNLPPMGTPPETQWPLDIRLRIKDAKVNLGTSLVEMDKTMEMFSNFSKGINGIWHSFVKKQPKRRRRKITPCDVPASYLTATYGIEPLVGDLMDSIEALDTRLESPVYKRFSSKSKLEKEIDDEQWSVSDKVVVYLELLPNANSKFTLGNIGELAWERVPFSFVVDWGIGVGDYLSALDALSGYKLHAGTRTTKIDMKAVYPDAELNGFPNGLSGSYPERLASRTYTSHSRSVLTDIPFPARPRFEVSRSYRRLANAVSLLWAVNKKCSYRR